MYALFLSGVSWHRPLSFRRSLFGQQQTSQNKEDAKKLKIFKQRDRFLNKPEYRSLFIVKKWYVII